jgi:hypothetical protein
MIVMLLFDEDCIEKMGLEVMLSVDLRKILKKGMIIITV